jgi:outer membrane protein assembly factor BamB
MGGVGPRATPTFADGRVYALGANGLLNCLDAAKGKPIWARDIKLDGEKKTPYWGFCGSPLVVDGNVIIFAGGGGQQGRNAEGAGGDAQDADKNNDDKDENAKEEPPANAKTLIAYNAETGDIAWQAPSGSHSYSSPQFETIDDIEQVLFLSDLALQSVDPATGEELWSLPTNAAAGQSMPSLQPTRLEGSDFFVNFNATAGVIRARVRHKDGNWVVDDVWFTRKLKPFFNDFVRVGEDLYGFDGKYFCCVDAETNKHAWKHKGYGSGQALLLADQPILIVISEAGEAVLVAANSEKHEELGKFQAVEGKTWNHPTIVGGRLYVRSAEEMACYEL